MTAGFLAAAPVAGWLADRFGARPFTVGGMLLMAVTFVALVISIVLMFLMHQLQLQQERLVLEVQSYAERRLLRHMQVREL